MKKFKFTAKDIHGKVVSGTVKASSRNDVIRRMSNKGMEPLLIEKQKEFFFGSGGVVNTRHIVSFTRQLGFLINAGVPIVQALRIVSDMIQSSMLQLVIKDVISNIEGGDTFSDALAQHPQIFNHLFISIVESGEQSGNLDRMLDQLATYLEESDKIKNKVKKAMMYPSFIFVVGIGVTIGIMVFVVPKFSSIFETNDQPLPVLTKILLATSTMFVENIGIVLMVTIVIPTIAIFYLKSPAGRKLKDQLLMITPIFGALLFQNSIARFSRTLACLMAAGVNVTDAMNTSAMTANNVFVEAAIKDIRNQVVKGKSMGVAFKSQQILPSLVANMVSVGEETGSIDATMEKVAEFYEENVRVTANNMADLIQPFLIVFLGGIVGFVVISLYLPIIKMPGILGGA